jgi:hypothetical protein
LIVAGGTLAALPFRRYQAIPDASTAPAQVTGPLHGSLELPLPRAIANADRDTAEPPSTVDFSATAYTYAAPGRSLTIPKPRRADIPLTYEDLEIPIDQPDVIKQRFNATALIRAEQLAAEQVPQIVMPALDSLAEAEVQQIRQAASRFAETAPQPARVSGALASAREPVAEPLPKSDAQPQPRHWIRQPD